MNGLARHIDEHCIREKQQYGDDCREPGDGDVGQVEKGIEVHRLQHVR